MLVHKQPAHFQFYFKTILFVSVLNPIPTYIYFISFIVFCLFRYCVMCVCMFVPSYPLPSPLPIRPSNMNIVATRPCQAIVVVVAVGRRFPLSPSPFHHIFHSPPAPRPPFLISSTSVHRAACSQAGNLLRL